METGCDGRLLKTDPRSVDYSNCIISASGDMICNTRTLPSSHAPKRPTNSSTMPGFFAQGTSVASYDPTKYDWINGTLQVSHLDSSRCDVEASTGSS